MLSLYIEHASEVRAIISHKNSGGLEIITQSGDRLLDMINDVLDLSRLDANRANLNHEQIELNKFLAVLHSMVLSLIATGILNFPYGKARDFLHYL